MKATGCLDILKRKQDYTKNDLKTCEGLFPAENNSLQWNWIYKA